MIEAEKPINILNSSPDSKLYEYKLGIERITMELVKFGLTKTQAKVFIYLGKYGSKSSPEVCKDLKMPRTETYQILNELINHGIVVSEFSYPAKFSAIPMEKAISTMIKTEQTKIVLLAEKEKVINDLWNQIPSFFTKSNEPQGEKFQMLQGSSRIHSKMQNMISNSKIGCKLLCGAKDLSRFYYANLMELFEASSSNMKLLISSDAVVPHLIQNMNKSSIRTWPKNMAKNQCFLLKDDDELLIFLRNANFPTRTIFAFWTNSKSLIDSIYLLFDYSWNHSKPIKQANLIISELGI
jgi:HTH-type transcriptional regulator, sugar sensing transcriptional regulator